MKGWMYILKCSDDSYYTGSTNNLELRLLQHQNGEGANHTKKRLPEKLVYYEEFERVDEAFYREKQVQGWSRIKKEALIAGQYVKLPELSVAYRDKVSVSSRTSDTKPRTSDTELLPEALEGSSKEAVRRRLSKAARKRLSKAALSKSRSLCPPPKRHQSDQNHPAMPQTPYPKVHAAPLMANDNFRTTTY